ncbi:MAG: DoxX family protein [Asticcacaulis sp.]
MSGADRLGTKPNEKLDIWLWAAQFGLAAIFAAYAAKAFVDIPTLSRYINWADEVPVWIVRFTGISEGLAAIGLVVPAATRILPVLTPLAAAGMVATQLSALLFHILRGEFIVVPGNLVLLGLCVFVLWGRWKVVPIAGRF